MLIALSLVALAPAPAAAGPGVGSQPDLRLRRAGGPLRGNDIYSPVTEPNVQTVNLEIYKGNVRNVYISVQNDGPDAALMSIAGYSVDGPSPFWFNVRYFSGDTEIGDPRTVEKLLAPGEKFVIRARIEVGTAPKGVAGFHLTYHSVYFTHEDIASIWLQRK
jgi:hypothetical protein